MILDHIDNLRLTEENREKYYNALQVHHRLDRGLEYLNGQVLRIETDLRIRMHLDGQENAMFAGNHPYARDVPFDLVSCCFDWYAVSVCNYVRIVGWLVSGGDPNRADEYLNRVVPAEVITYRNKVGAHVSFSTKNRKNRDTPADHFLSSLSAKWDITFQGDALYAGALTVSLGSGEGGSTSAPMEWSLTKIHKELAKRYWPSGTP